MIISFASCDDVNTCKEPVANINDAVTVCSAPNWPAIVAALPYDAVYSNLSTLSSIDALNPTADAVNWL